MRDEGRILLLTRERCGQDTQWEHCKCEIPLFRVCDGVVMSDTANATEKRSARDTHVLWVLGGEGL